MFKLDYSKFEKKLREKQKRVVQAAIDSQRVIHNTIHDGVFDNTNWNPKATYSPKDPYHAGEKYDLIHTGNLYSTLKNEEISVKTISGSSSIDRVSVRYGSIANLDANAPYWRTFVYGRAEIKDMRYEPTDFDISSTGKIKHTGIVYGSEGSSIKAIEPTWMFDTWHLNVGDKLHKYIEEQLGAAWRK